MKISKGAGERFGKDEGFGEKDESSCERVASSFILHPSSFKTPLHPCIPTSWRHMRKVKVVMKYLLSVFFVLAGVNHFINPDFYVNIMPPYLPRHLELVYLSGFFEVALGVMVLIRRHTRLAAWGLIALLVAVFPANIHMAVNAHLYPDISPIGLWIRLPFQGVFIAWAWWFTRPAAQDAEK